MHLFIVLKFTYHIMGYLMYIILLPSQTDPLVVHLFHSFLKIMRIPEKNLSNTFNKNEILDFATFRIALIRMGQDKVKFIFCIFFQREKPVSSSSNFAKFVQCRCVIVAAAIASKAAVKFISHKSCVAPFLLVQCT